MKELLRNKKFIGFYILWVTFHFVLFILSIANENYYYDMHEKFWPVADTNIYYTYDYTEFIFYTILPIAIIISIKYLRNNEK